MSRITKLGIMLILFISAQSLKAQLVETRSLASFNKVEMKGAGELILKKSNENKVKVSLQKGDLSDLTTEVRNNTLYIRYEKKNYDGKDRLMITLSYKAIEALSLAGAIKMDNSDLIKANSFTFESRGANKVNLEIAAQRFQLETSGADHLTIKGRAPIQSMEVSGAAQVNALDLAGEEVTAEIRGAVHLKVNASKTLNAQAYGAAHLRYKGSPDLNVIKKGVCSVSKI
ncbi:MAG: head GIN domain-containing protein [Bacteroidota bacterium]